MNKSIIYGGAIALVILGAIYYKGSKQYIERLEKEGLKANQDVPVPPMAEIKENLIVKNQPLDVFGIFESTGFKQLGFA